MILDAAEFELAPFIVAIDFADHCESQASIFQILAADESGEAASMQSWVVTSETCSQRLRRHQPADRLRSARRAALGASELGPGEWAENSTDVLEGLVGGWRGPADGGKSSRTRGCTGPAQQLPEARNLKKSNSSTAKGSNDEEVSHRAWELSIHEGSSPAGFSG